MDSDLSRPPATLPRPGEGRERSKVLIIGAKGMLGQALVEDFSKDHEVIAWDRDEIDITDPNSIRRLADENSKPNLVINSAAYNDVDGAEENLELANAVNGYAVGYLAKTCRELDIPLVHYSTEYVFEGEKQEGYKEDDTPRPVNAYGRSKLLGEQELRKNTGKFYLIRLSRLFGRTTSPSIPPQAWGGRGGVETRRKRSFVELMLELAKTKTEIDVVDEEFSSPTYAPDLAKRTRYIVENKLPFGIYHSPNLGACTWYGFAQEIFKISGINVKLNPVPAAHFPRSAKRPKFAVLLDTRLEPMQDWRAALREFLTTRE